jgi:hypothetical protein
VANATKPFHFAGDEPHGSASAFHSASTLIVLQKQHTKGGGKDRCHDFTLLYTFFLILSRVVIADVLTSCKEELGSSVVSNGGKYVCIGRILSATSRYQILALWWRGRSTYQTRTWFPMIL